MKVGIVNLHLGNIYSLYSCLIKITDKKNCFFLNNIKEISKCDKLIFPGQGDMKKVKENYKNIDFLIKIKEFIKKKPFLGICLGSQLLFKKNYESNTNGLCLFDKDVLFFSKNLNNFKIPFIGWNKVFVNRYNYILNGIKKSSYFYFSHSYYTDVNNNTLCYSYSKKKIGVLYSKKNIYLTQFHPEKSSFCGIKILNNFLKIK